MRKSRLIRQLPRPHLAQPRPTPPIQWKQAFTGSGPVTRSSDSSDLARAHLRAGIGGALSETNDCLDLPEHTLGQGPSPARQVEPVLGSDLGTTYR